MSDTDCMFVVLNNKALAIDFTGTPIQCNLIQDHENDIEYVDWDSADPIDWLDLKPDQYQLYKMVIDFLHQFSQQPAYVK